MTGPRHRRPAVLLINPRICSRRSIRLPLSLLALGAALEGEHRYQLLDGNVDADAGGSALGFLAAAGEAVAGVSVMPGPQVGPAIAISTAIRAAHPGVPIVWGGYFPTLYPGAAIHAPYVDYVVRGQGEDTFRELLAALAGGGPHGGPNGGPNGAARDLAALAAIRGLTWKDEDGTVVHNADRAFRPPDELPPLPYERVGDVARYLRPSFMGSRTAVHQAAIGCRYHCEFCGVVSMWNGFTRLQGAARLAAAGAELRDRWGATALQFYDHNFFDTEEGSIPLLAALEGLGLPWWCYARADTLAGFSARTWQRIRRSRLAMAYIGAESASDEALRRMKKGSRVEHTLEVAHRCREHGVIPELSFILGGPDGDQAAEIESTFRFIRRIKAIHPESEVVLYFYSPTPRREPASELTRAAGRRLPVLERYGPDGPELPSTPEEWTEPRWLDYVCHRDAPWLTPRLRRRVHDFATVLGCRFPTVQDHHTPAWGKALLRGLASWRYRTGRYGGAWELALAKRLLDPREPQRESL
ncbi:MAG TPA: cobalamin-dependent protein [Thermoanaerobaculia bacterium]|nr:cobalamin-dependent protein [Thermoanaerobaculia bacterium]